MFRGSLSIQVFHLAHHEKISVDDKLLSGIVRQKLTAKFLHQLVYQKIQISANNVYIKKLQIMAADSGEDAECHAAKLLEVLLIQFKGKIDQVRKELIFLSIFISYGTQMCDWNMAIFVFTITAILATSHLCV